jgi:hypothetical protein
VDGESDRVVEERVNPMGGLPFPNSLLSKYIYK